jgi:hypothetical protein
MEFETKDLLLVAGAPLIRVIVETIKLLNIPGELSQPLAILISAVFFGVYMLLPDGVQVLILGALTMAGAASVYHDVRKPFIHKIDE